MAIRIIVPNNNEFFRQFFTVKNTPERQRIKETISKPDSKELFYKNDEIYGGVFVKQFDSVIYLVGAKSERKTWYFDFGFKLHSFIIEEQEIDAKRIFNIFVDKFGQEIPINDISSNLLWNEKFVFKSKNNLGVIEDLNAKIVDAQKTNTNVDNLVYFIWGNSNSENNIVHFFLFFCINVYEYTQWYFNPEKVEPDFSKWLPTNDDVEFVDISISLGEVNFIRHQIKQRYPDDKEYALLEGIRLQIAYRVIYEAFGENTYKEILHPTSRNFINRGFSDPDEQRLSNILVTQLANALLKVKNVAGFQEQLKSVKQGNFDNVESLWFEFHVAEAIMRGGHTMSFIPSSVEGKSPDLLVDFHGQLIPVEIKTKEEDTNFDNKPTRLTSLIRKGIKQLPLTGPGVVCLMIPSHWSLDKKFIERHRELITNILLEDDNRHCNLVFIWWFEKTQISDKKLAVLWRVLALVSNNPKHRISGISKLVKLTSLDVAMLETDAIDELIIEAQKIEDVEDV